MSDSTDNENDQIANKDQVGLSEAVIAQSREVMIKEGLTDLSHSNPYIAFSKSVLWGTVAYIAVALTAIGSTWLVAYFLKFLIPGAPSELLFMIDSFGIVASAVSFSFLIIVMALEGFQLLAKLAMRGKGGDD